MEKSSFFNSIAGDRKYKAVDFASYFSKLLTNGVFPNPSTNLQVISNNNMTITIKAGAAWINGYIYILDADMVLPISVADGLLKRIDRIVVRFDTVGRGINAVIKGGTFASSPVAPVLQRDADRYELGIADVLVNNGVVIISQANITDLRLDTTKCGLVNSLIQADTTAIFDQYQAWFTTQSNAYNAEMIGSETQFQADFTAWFATIQGQLAGDIAGNLLAQINTKEPANTNIQTHVASTHAPSNAEQNVNADWNSFSGDSMIINKPAIIPLSTLLTSSLAAATWTGSTAPFSYVLTVAGITATSNQEILPTITITAAELLALQSANIVDGGQGVGSITLKAYGTKPTIAIPIRVIRRGDIV